MTGNRDSSGRFVSTGEIGTMRVAITPGFFEEWKRGEECRDLMASAARRVAADASRLAPDDPTGPPKDLHSSIRGTPVLTEDGWHGRVSVLNFKGHWYEFGTSTRAARPFLRPAAMAAGLRLEADP